MSTVTGNMSIINPACVPASGVSKSFATHCCIHELFWLKVNLSTDVVQKEK